MFAGKPVIGIVGGIGSGKSTVADLFAEHGCLVIHSDEQVSQAYRDEQVRAKLRQWWGNEAFDSAGQVNRRFIAGKVFTDPGERKRLEELLHPWVNQAREKLMQAAANDPKIAAFVWDTPLLLETSLNRQCDAVVFVDASPEVRLERLRRTRNWDEAELLRRENSQWPLDKKREISDYVVRNTADVGFARGQVKDVISRILTRAKQRG